MAKAYLTDERKDLLFNFDPTDLSAMRKLMDRHGDSNKLFVGMNTEAERTTISIFREKIICMTYQHNGWVRKNTYWRDGTREETFDGRWKELSHDG